MEDSSAGIEPLCTRPSVIHSATKAEFI